MTTPNLSPSQSRVLAALLDGRSRQEIARDSWLALKTIDSHISAMRQRLEDQGLTLQRTYVLKELK